jgi:hypothetical protein
MVDLCLDRTPRVPEGLNPARVPVLPSVMPDAAMDAISKPIRKECNLLAG